jgi:hypothetical protein
VAELRANMVRVDADFNVTPFNSDTSRESRISGMAVARTGKSPFSECALRRKESPPVSTNP